MNSILNKSELLEKCKELGFTKYKSLNKSALIELINAQTTVEKEKEVNEEPEPTKLKI